MHLRLNKGEKIGQIEKSLQGKYQVDSTTAIADSHKLFITSASLTQYAFTLNMEMGVLIQSRHLANQVERQIKDLIENDILTRLL